MSYIVVKWLKFNKEGKDRGSGSFTVKAPIHRPPDSSFCGNRKAFHPLESIASADGVRSTADITVLQHSHVPVTTLFKWTRTKK